MKLLQRNPWSRLAILCSVLVYLYAFFYYDVWRDGSVVNGGDVLAYYIYLPSTFIHDDIKTLDKTFNSIFDHPNTHIKNYINNSIGCMQAVTAPNGNLVVKTTAGVAFFMLPFFLLAHFFSLLFGFTADGFSLPYIFAVHASQLVCTFAAWLLLRKILLRYVSDAAAAATIFCIALGTNLYFINVLTYPFSHAYLFFLYALLIWSTIQFYERYSLNMAVAIGFSAGMIILIRPNEIYCLAIPLLYGVLNLSSLVDRGKEILKYWKLFLAASVTFLCVFIPQFIYWKHVSGHWLFYSYGNESFNFDKPEQIILGLFTFCNGWFAYTPLMFLAFAGFWFMFKQRNRLALPSLIFIVLHIYVAYSWWCWFYMGSFGSRAMIQTYAIMSLPLAYFYDWSFSKKYFRFIAIALGLFFCFHNIFQSHQQALNILLTEAGNFNYIKSIFGKTHTTREDFICFDTEEIQPDTSKIYSVGKIHEDHFEDTTIAYSDTACWDGKASIRLKSGTQSNTYVTTLKQMGAKPGDYIKASVYCMSRVHMYNIYQQSMLVIVCKRGDKIDKWKGVRLQTKINNPENKIWHNSLGNWGEGYLFTKVPKNLQPEDEIQVYLMNDQGMDAWLDNLQVELWRERR